jgi:hypothetical protein
MVSRSPVCHSGAMSFGSVGSTRAETMVVIATSEGINGRLIEEPKPSGGSLVSSQVSTSGWKVTSADSNISGPQMSKTDTAITTVGYNLFLYCSHECKGVLRFSLVGSVDPSALQGNFRRRPSTDLSALIKRISTMHVHGRSSLLTPDMVPYPRSFLRLPAAAAP